MRLFPLILMLTACTTPQKFNLSEIDGNTYSFKINLVDTLPDNRSGLYTYDKRLDMHYIWLIKSEFPRCLEHEILHIFDRDWHKGRVSTEYCYSR